MNYNKESLDYLKEDYKKFDNVTSKFFASVPFLVMGGDIFLGTMFLNPDHRQSHKSIELQYEHLDLETSGGGVVYISNHQLLHDYGNGEVLVGSKPNDDLSVMFHVRAYSGDYGSCSPEARQFVADTIKMELEKFNFNFEDVDFNPFDFNPE